MGKGANPRAEEEQGCLPLEAQNQNIAGEKLDIGIIPFCKEDSLSRRLCQEQAFRGHRKSWKRKLIFSTVFNVICLSVIICLSVAYSELKKRQRNDEPGVTTTICPEGWLWYGGKCYFFSMNDTEWEMAQEFCEAQGASLAIVNSKDEWNFLKRFKGNPDRWIGLKRNAMNLWEWTDGKTFDNTFTVTGDSDCAYLNELGTNSARCYADRKWICSRGAAQDKRNLQSNL